MKSKVLKFIIIIAFVGIIAVTGIVLINNHNVEDKGYKSIVEQNVSIDIDSLILNAGGVKKAYGASAAIDEYATYLAKAFSYLEEGIDYYFNYFDNVKGMSRQAKDDIVKLHSNYIASLKVAKNALGEYNSLANMSTSIITNAQVNQVPALAATFIKQFANAYAEGVKYFDMLSHEISKLVYGLEYKDFTMISYEMCSVFVNKSISFVKQTMESRVAGSSGQPLSASVHAQNFLKVYEATKAKTKITPSNELINQTYYNFVSNYNKIDGRKLLDDSATYIASLAEEQKLAANAVKTFLTSSTGYSLVIGG